MIISTWDFNQNFIPNAKANLIAESMAKSLSFRTTEGMIDRFGTDGDFFGTLNMLPYIRETYGAAKPICLGDRIIREIHRILIQIREFLDDVVTDVDDFLDNTIPGWEELGGTWEFFQDEVLTRFEDEVLKPIEGELKDAWNSFTDWVSDPC